MWYIFDTTHTLQGIIDEIEEITITHSFTEVDTFQLLTPYTIETYEALKIGVIVTKAQGKAYRIHSIEIDETEKTIFAVGYGLEALLENRVVLAPKTYANTEAGDVVRDLVDQNVVNPTNSDRKIAGVELGTNLVTGTPIDAAFYGQSLYEIASSAADRYGVGFRFFFDPRNKKTIFDVYLPKDRTTTQQINEPVLWTSEWGDVQDEMIIQSKRDHKNVVTVVSGDETSPIETTMGEAAGWDRFEHFAQAGDVTKALQDENGVPLTTGQLTELLKTKAYQHLYRRRPLSDYTFSLDENIGQEFEKDYFVGDLVTVKSEKYGITMHARIATVKEVIIKNSRMLTITFDQ